MAIDEDAVADTTDFEVGTARVLVRPYVGEYTSPGPGDEPGVDAAEESADPLPLTPRARYPRVLEAVRRHRRRDSAEPAGRHVRRDGRGPWLVLLAASVATAAVLIVAAVVIAATGGRASAPGGHSQPQAPAPGAAKPGVLETGGAGQSDPVPPGATTPPGSTADPAATRSLGTTTGSTGDPTRATDPTRPTDPSGSPSGGTPTGQPVPSSPPPVTDLSGRISNVAGLCLSAVGVDDRVRLWDCDGSAGQVWTLGTDGTLRALGQCMQDSSGLVRLRNCDGGPAQQWRVGLATFLVNPASTTCLGDPQAGNNKGTPQRTAPCDQSDTQRWALPRAG